MTHFPHKFPSACFGIALIALGAAPAMAQVKAVFPGPHRIDSPTPLQRSFPAQPPARPPTGNPPISPPTQWPGGGGMGGGGWCNPGGVVVGGSGLTVDGAYTSNNFDLAFHLGSGYPATTGCVRYPCGNVCYYPGIYYGGWGWYNDYYYGGYYDNSDQHYAVVDGALVQPIYMTPPASTAQPAAEPPPPPTDAEIGAALLRSGDASGAVDKYRAYLRDHAADADAMRCLAIALLANGDPDQGVAMMSMAYRTSVALVDQPVADEMLFKSDADLRKAVVKAVNFANKIKSASSWLTVAVLMQAEGRKEHAGRMVDRASDLGLDAALVKKFKTALGQ